MAGKETVVRLQSSWKLDSPEKALYRLEQATAVGGKSILISFSATAMWESQKKDFPTNHAPGGVHGDLHFAYGTLVVHKRVKA